MRIVETYPVDKMDGWNNIVHGVRFIPCHNRSTAQWYLDHAAQIEDDEWETDGYEVSPFYVIE